MTLPALARAARTGLVVSGFAFFWGGAVALAWVVLPIAALGRGDGAARTRRCQRIVRRGFRVFLAYLRRAGLLEVCVDGDVELPDGPAVLVANHPTLVDVTAILSRWDGICCIAKAPYGASPFVGRLMRLAGFVDGGDDIASRVATVATAMGRLREGFHVLVFPEGSRSPPGGLRPFHRGAFEMACRAGVPVVPLHLQCDPPVLFKGHRPWNFPEARAHLRVRVGAPLAPAAVASNAKALRTVVERGYQTQVAADAGGDGDAP